MPGDVIEIAPDSGPRSRSEEAAFANHYAAILAEHAIQSNDQDLQRRTPGLSSWLVLAFPSGAVIAVVFVYFFGQ
jgi:hypothetical protein